VTSQSLAEELTVHLKAELCKKSLHIYRGLVCLAIEVAKGRGYSPSVTQVTFFVPSEVVAFNLGMSRTTLWRRLEPLEARGLVEHREHKTTLNGQTRTDGTLWAVRLTPTRGKRVRLSYEDMKHSWRDLEGDVKRGRTAFNEMKQSKKPKDQQEIIKNLLSWALPPQNQETPLSLTVSRAPEAIFDLPYAAKEERGEMVNAVAAGICHHLGDNSLNFYRRLLWQLLRLHDRHQDYFAAVHDAIIRAGVDKREGFARKPGALLVSRLKESGLWELLRSTPAYRVGVRPLAA
jgi:DNA-binding Lrp family transcriptional regulator